MNKELKDKAVDIKGKKYVLVSDRVIYFNETYSKGCIVTKVDIVENKVSANAKVYPEGLEGRYFTGHSQEVEGSTFINKTSAVENAETSAVGRALAMMGIGVIDSIASVDEINKANNRTKSDQVGTIAAGDWNKSEQNVCPKCGAKMRISKLGKPYCSALCWRNKPIVLRNENEIDDSPIDLNNPPF